MQSYQGLYLLFRNFYPNVKKKYGNLFELGLLYRLALIMVQLFQSLLFRGLTFGRIDCVFYRIGNWLFFHIDQG